MENEAKKRFLLNIAVIGVSVILIWLVSEILFVYLLPFVIAGVLAYSVQRVAKYIEKKTNIKQTTAASILVVVVYMLLATLVSILVWRIAAYGINFSENVISYFKNNTEKFSDISAKLSAAINFLPESTHESVISAVQSTFADGVRIITTFTSKTATQIVKKMPQLLFCIAVTIIASCYIAKDYKRLKLFIEGVVERKYWLKTIEIKNILIESVIKMLWGYIKLSFVTFIELTIAFFVIGIKYAPILAALIALIDLLPVLGCGTVLLPWSLGCFIAGNIYRGVALCIIYVLILVVRYYLEPKIIGKGVGINPLFILLAMFLGLNLGGIGGVLIFPVVLIVTVNYYKKQMSEENIDAHKPTF